MINKFCEKPSEISNWVTKPKDFINDKISEEIKDTLM